MVTRLIAILVALALAVAACDHGTVTDGVCVCDDGWAGRTCSVRDCHPFQRLVDGECVCPPPFVGENCDHCPGVGQGEFRVCAVFGSAITPMTVTLAQIKDAMHLAIYTKEGLEQTPIGAFAMTLGKDVAVFEPLIETYGGVAYDCGCVATTTADGQRATTRNYLSTLASERELHARAGIPSDSTVSWWMPVWVGTSVLVLMGCIVFGGIAVVLAIIKFG